VSYTGIYAFGVSYQTKVASAKSDTMNKEVNLNFYKLLIRVLLVLRNGEEGGGNLPYLRDFFRFSVETVDNSALPVDNLLFYGRGVGIKQLTLLCEI
jgi:hypothetical protein